MKFVDRLYDSVHGYVELTEPEVRIINTPLFHRLHFISQMGLLRIIFPSAVHTRFAHSLGVLHIVEKITEHLKNEGASIDLKEHETLRMAALLHDIGHFPFSHVGEYAAAEVEMEKLTPIARPKPSQKPSYFPYEERKAIKGLHESMAALIVENCSEITSVLKEADIDPKLVGRIITGGSDALHTFILHSELDADKMDYLIRDSSFMGVQYGQIELDHIIKQMKLITDDEGRMICVKDANLHSIEHFLFARFFVYCQIINAPKVRFLEEILKEVIRYMISLPNNGELSRCKLFSYEELSEKIKKYDQYKHAIYDYNDNEAMSKMRKLHDLFDAARKSRSNKIGRKKLMNHDIFVDDSIKMILSGRIPAPAISSKITSREQKRRTEIINSFKNHIDDKKDELAKSLNTETEWLKFYFPWTELSKLKSSYSPDESSQPRLQVRNEAIRVIRENGSKEYLVEFPGTIFKHVGDVYTQAFFGFTHPFNVDPQKAREVFSKVIDTNLLNL